MKTAVIICHSGVVSVSDPGGHTWTRAELPCSFVWPGSMDDKYRGYYFWYATIADHETIESFTVTRQTGEATVGTAENVRYAPVVANQRLALRHLAWNSGA